MSKRIFSGAQPSGTLHLGNYLGALRNWARLQSDDTECLYCIVDMHAITVWQDPKALQNQVRAAAAAYIASGVDPKRSILFNQSRVPGHAELAWIFNCVSRLGWLNRMTQFKDKAGKNRENASTGLYVYPNLMAADILLYKATHVPVGEDQKQHLELTRDIAQKFNHDFGVELFPLTEPLILKEGARIMSLRDGTKKMSKSDPSEFSCINLNDDADTLAQKIRKAKTDGDLLPAKAALLADRPEAKNLVSIYAALTDNTQDAICAEFEGKGFGDFKKALTEVVVEKLAPITTEMARLEADPAYIDSLLKTGGEEAQDMAAPILAEVKKTVGFLG
ncbi:MAG: tryptophan--tRNA ligase [Kordiimonadaceae bacterium]|nr:tryptophan--tRNA ligase [Kordiimonadaceae bacterium]